MKNTMKNIMKNAVETNNDFYTPEKMDFYKTVEEREHLIDTIASILKEARNHVNDEEEFSKHIIGINMWTEDFIDLTCK